MDVVLSREPTRLQMPTGKEPFHVWSFPDGTVWTYFYRNGSDYLLRFPELADFEVSADWPHGALLAGTRHLGIHR